MMDIWLAVGAFCLFDAEVKSFYIFQTRDWNLLILKPVALTIHVERHFSKILKYNIKVLIIQQTLMKMDCISKSSLSMNLSRILQFKILNPWFNHQSKELQNNCAAVKPFLVTYLIKLTLCSLVTYLIKLTLCFLVV